MSTNITLAASVNSAVFSTANNGTVSHAAPTFKAWSEGAGYDLENKAERKTANAAFDSARRAFWSDAAKVGAAAIASAGERGKVVSRLSCSLTGVEIIKISPAPRAKANKAKALELENAALRAELAAMRLA